MQPWAGGSCRRAMVLQCMSVWEEMTSVFLLPKSLSNFVMIRISSHPDSIFGLGYPATPGSEAPKHRIKGGWGGDSPHPCTLPAFIPSAVPSFFCQSSPERSSCLSNHNDFPLSLGELMCCFHCSNPHSPEQLLWAPGHAGGWPCSCCNHGDGHTTESHGPK